MKTQRPYPALTITPKGERALVDGPRGSTPGR